MENSEKFEHITHLSHLIHPSKQNEISLVVTLLDLRNVFGEGHHNLISVVSAYHQTKQNIIKAVMSAYEVFSTTIAVYTYYQIFM